MFKKLSLAFFLLISFPAISSNYQKSLQDANAVKKYKNAGVCFGAYEGAVAGGSTISDLGETARNKLIKSSKDYAIVDKYGYIRKRCHLAGKTVPETFTCIDKSISKKAIAAFWKGYVAGLEGVYGKQKAEAAILADLVCLLEE